LHFAVREKVKLSLVILGASDGEALTVHKYNPTAVLSVNWMLPPFEVIAGGVKFFVESELFKHIKE
jgi:hypothetical protein